MRRKAQASVVGFALFVGLFFAGFWYVSSISADADFSINENFTRTDNFAVSQNWLNGSDVESYTDSCQESTDGETLFVKTGSCLWESKPYNVSEYPIGLPYQFEVVGEVPSGSGNLTVTTINSTGSIVHNETVSLPNGVETYNLSDDFQNDDVSNITVDVYLESSDQRVDLNSFDLVIEGSEESQDVGLTQDSIEIMTIIVFLFAGVLMAANFMS